MKVIFYTVLFLFIFLSTTFAGLITNKDLIDSTVNEFTHNLYQKLNDNNIKSIVIITDDNFSTYILDKITNELINKGLKIYTKVNDDPDNKILQIKLFQKNFDITYEMVDDKEYSRKISFEMIVFNFEKSGEVKEFSSFSQSFNDVIPFSELSNIEDPNFPITKGKIPPKKSSWLDEVLEPVVIITASIVSVVLFFTVRSK